MHDIQFWFNSHRSIALDKVQVKTRIGSDPRICYRGKMPCSQIHQGTFQWTRAVKALSILILRSRGATSPEYLLVGTRGDAAASLDYALSKQPQWMHDMFGSDVQGRSVLKSMIVRRNAEFKHGPNVHLILKDSIVDALTIYLDNGPVKNKFILNSMADCIENGKELVLEVPIHSESDVDCALVA